MSFLSFEASVGIPCKFEVGFGLGGGIKPAVIIETSYLILCSQNRSGVWRLNGSDSLQHFSHLLDRIGIWGTGGPVGALSSWWLTQAVLRACTWPTIVFGWVVGVCQGAFTCMPVVNQILVSHSGHINLIIVFQTLSQPVFICNFKI